MGSAQTPKKEVKPAGEDIFRPLLRTTSAAAVLMHAPHGDRDKQEGRAGQGHSEKLLYRDVSQAAQTDAVLLKLRGNQEASQEIPSEKRASRLSTPDIDSGDQSQLDWGVSVSSLDQRDLQASILGNLPCSESLHMHIQQMEILLAQGACNLGYNRRAVSFAMPSGGKGTVSGPQVSQEMSMVDLWLPLKTTAPTHVQQSSGGWQTRMEAAGGAMRHTQQPTPALRIRSKMQPSLTPMQHA